MPRATGIEITDSLVKIVEAELCGKTARILHAGTAPLPEPKDRLPDEKVAEVVTTLIRARKIGASSCVTSVDTAEAVVREISLPFKSNENIRKTIKFEMESHIHHAPIEDMVVDFSRVIQGEQESESELLLIAAVPRASVARSIRILSQASAEPEVVDFDMLAAFSSFSIAGQFEETPTCILLVVDEKRVKMLLVDEKQPRIVRSLQLAGGEAQGKTGAGARQSASKDGEQRSSASPEPVDEKPARPGSFFAAIDDLTIQKLAMEMERMILSAVPTNPPSVVLVSATEAESESLEPVLAKLSARCGLLIAPVSIFSKLDKTPEIEDDLPDSAMAIPTGLALRGLGLSTVSMNFRRETLAYRRSADAIKLSLVWTLAFACVFLVLFVIYARQRLKNAETQFTEIREEQKTLFAEICPGRPLPEDVSPLDALRQFRKELEELFGEQNHPLPVSALDFWKELFSRIGSPKVFTVEMLDISLTKQSITMKGHTGDMPTAEQVLTNIKGVSEEQRRKFPMFQNARAVEYTREKNETIKYYYEIKWSK
jgi:Tfp pilus assembly PilM family ATPase